HCDFSTDGRDIHDASVSSPPHSRQDSESGVHSRPEVRSHCRIKIVELLIFERPDLNRASVVDEHVDWSKRFLNRFQCEDYLIVVSQVALNRQEAISDRRELLARTRQFLLIPGAN